MRNTLDRRKKPIVVYGLFRLIYQITKTKGISLWSMISEKHLFNAVTAMGFIFHPIGREVEYHGIRTPHLAFIDEMEDYWIEHKKDFMRFLVEGLDEKYWPASDAFKNLMKEIH